MLKPDVQQKISDWSRWVFSATSSVVSENTNTLLYECPCLGFDPHVVTPPPSLQVTLSSC